MVLEVLSAAEILVWLDGGWGIDALVGEQTTQRLAGATGRRLGPSTRLREGRGEVAGRSVPCITPELQLRHHLGCPLDETDRHELEALAGRYDLALPPSLGSNPA